MTYSPDKWPLPSTPSYRFYLLTFFKTFIPFNTWLDLFNFWCFLLRKNCLCGKTSWSSKKSSNLFLFKQLTFSPKQMNPFYPWLKRLKCYDFLSLKQMKSFPIWNKSKNLASKGFLFKLSSKYYRLYLNITLFLIQKN